MRLSVVITVVDGSDALDRCLTALSEQEGAPDLDVIVPWDSTVSGIPERAVRFPAFRFLPLGTLDVQQPAEGPAAQHELFDRRRSAGLAVATGDVIAMIEERGVPRRDWARKMLAAHARLSHAVIGGAIANGIDAPLPWAVFFCDFNRYQPPFQPGPRAYVSDVNIGYKRRAIEQTEHVWRDRYLETTVHWALQRAGETLFLTPEFVVDQFRTGITMAGLLRERFAWGRLFAYTRARELTAVRRLVLALTAPALPLVLMVRHTRLQASRRVTFGRFLRVSPIVLLLLIVWSAGESLGYITGRP